MGKILQKLFIFFFVLWSGFFPIALQAQIKPLVKTTATHAVVIGISGYQDPAIPDLRFAHKDAEAFASYLRSPAGGSLDEDHLKILINEQATAGRIAEALDALVEQVREGDQVIIYFSGHGDVERKTVSQPGFLLAWDAPSRVYIGGGNYSLSFLQEIVPRFPLKIWRRSPSSPTRAMPASFPAVRSVAPAHLCQSGPAICQ